jgi:DNA invertase Pin-like site-specific DNA recombinase
MDQLTKSEGRRTMKVAIYARVSTANNGQDPTMQTRELREYAERRGWTVAGEYVDIGISGTKEKRPELDRLVADAHRRRFDAVVVWKFDRFARSVSHLLRALETFKAQGIEFVSFSEQLDTSTPAGKLVFTVLGAVAELERSLIVERVKAGLHNARSKGKKLGPAPACTRTFTGLPRCAQKGSPGRRSASAWVLVKEPCIARRRPPPKTICGRSQQKGRPPYEGERKWGSGSV